MTDKKLEALSYALLKSVREVTLYRSDQRFFRWWCHFDDDVYVNTQTLPRLLNNHKPDEEFIYIGRQSKPDGFWVNIYN